MVHGPVSLKPITPPQLQQQQQNLGVGVCAEDNRNSLTMQQKRVLNVDLELLSNRLQHNLCPIDQCPLS